MSPANKRNGYGKSVLTFKNTFSLRWNRLTYESNESSWLTFILQRSAIKWLKEWILKQEHSETNLTRGICFTQYKRDAYWTIEHICVWMGMYTQHWDGLVVGCFYFPNCDGIWKFKYKLRFLVISNFYPL